MENFSINRLIVISEAEKASIELNFDNGLNIIAGKNTTGKSSLIKSLFYSFGCEVKFDVDWKKLDKRVLVFFTFKTNKYLIERKKNKYFLFWCDNSFEIKTGKELNFIELSEFFMQLLQINMSWLNKDGKSVPVSMPHILSFSYIDQDLGWQEVAKSFKKLDYVLKWKDKLIKYIVGYQTDEYFRTKEEIESTSILINDLNKKHDTNKEFLAAILNSFNNEFEPPTFENIDKLINKINEIERNIHNYKEKNASLRNDLYDKQLLIRALKRNSKEIAEDHKFSSGLEENIICPVCGVEHNNNIFARTELIKDIQICNNMVDILKNEISEIEQQIHSGKNKIIMLKKEYDELKNSLENNKNNMGVIESYKFQGKREIINKSEEQLFSIQKEIDLFNIKKLKLEDSLKNIESRKRRDSIRQGILDEINLICSEVDLKLDDIKLKNFLPVLDRTGSKGSRMLYVYYIALYLYRLNLNSIKFLVIDTPNQQGQDALNLKGIYNLLNYLTDKRGQVIIGTEKTEDYQFKSFNLILLTDKEKCLTSTNYDSHRMIIKKLDETLKMSNK